MLPPTISSLTSLKKISARNNHIHKIHRLDGERLAQLQMIDLSYNRLRKIEWAFGFHSLKGLTTLKLANNPITHVEAGALAHLY